MLNRRLAYQTGELDQVFRRPCFPGVALQIDHRSKVCSFLCAAPRCCCPLVPALQLGILDFEALVSASDLSEPYSKYLRTIGS